MFVLKLSGIQKTFINNYVEPKNRLAPSENTLEALNGVNN